MAKPLFGRLDWGQFGRGLFFAFIGLQLVSILASQFFPVFAELLTKFSLAWLVILLAIIISLIFRLVIGLKTFDRKSIFILLLALSILLAITIAFEVDIGRVFDMSIVKNQLASILPR